MKARHASLAVMVLALMAPATGSAQASALTLEQRLQRVEDELAIRRVLVDYAATQDARDYSGYAALFAEGRGMGEREDRPQGTCRHPQDAGRSVWHAAARLCQQR